MELLNLFPMKAFVFEKNKFQKRLFWLSNFPSAAILNNCDVTWLPYCSRTIALCIRTIGQPSYVTIIQDLSLSRCFTNGDTKGGSLEETLTEIVGKQLPYRDTSLSCTKVTTFFLFYVKREATNRRLPFHVNVMLNLSDILDWKTRATTWGQETCLKCHKVN